MIPSRTTLTAVLAAMGDEWDSSDCYQLAVLLDDGLDADCVCRAILASADAYDEDIYDGPLRAVIRTH